MTATQPEITLPPFEPDKGAPLDPPPPPPVEPELPPRSQRSRKRKGAELPPPETPAAPISDEDKEALGGLLATGFGVAFEIIAQRRGAHWKLSREEAMRLGKAWGEPLAPFLAKHSAYVPWAVALLATSGIVMPRLTADSEKQAADKLAGAENAETA